MDKKKNTLRKAPLKIQKKKFQKHAIHKKSIPKANVDAPTQKIKKEKGRKGNEEHDENNIKQEEEESPSIFSKPTKKENKNTTPKLVKEEVEEDEAEEEEQEANGEEDAELEDSGEANGDQEANGDEDGEQQEGESDETKEKETKRKRGPEIMKEKFKAVTFQSLKVSEWLIKQLSTMGIKAPSQIQQQAIPIIKSGRNVIGISHTGSGKTAAFAIPILDKLAEEPYSMFALVLSPTRELALQIADQFRAFGAPIHLKVAVIVGGENLLQQNQELDKRPHIVISTPGRLMGIIESTPTFQFKHMKFLVIDEADTMLHLNYSVQLKAILDFLPPPEKRQTLLFSATMSRSIHELSSISVDKPEIIRISKQFDTSPTLRQEYMFMPMKAKHTYLLYLLKKYRKSTIIIFVPSVQVAAELQAMFDRLKLSSSAIHSILTQEERKECISKFRDHKFNILVATNLASRGLDIPNVDIVINFDIPDRVFDYIHRVGRTARGGNRGRSISLVSQFEVDLLKDIEKRLEMRLLEHEHKEPEVMAHLTDAIQALKYAETKLANSNFSEKLAKVQQNTRESHDLVRESMEYMETMEPIEMDGEHEQRMQERGNQKKRRM